MGRLYKRGGTWYADYFDRSGTRQRTSTKTGDAQVARARLRELELQTTDRGQDETEELAVSLDYFTNVTHASSPAGTQRCYRQKAAHLHRLLGSLTTDEVKLEVVQRYIADRIDEGAHTHSIHKEMVVLRGALRGAQWRGRFHLGLDVVPKFDAAYSPRTTYLTPDEFLSLAEHLVPAAPAGASAASIATMRARAQRRALYCILIAYASPRRGELEAMEWSHVDIRRGLISIPKGKTFGRPIAIHPALRPWLEAFGDRAGWEGRVVEPWSNVGRDLPRAAERAGIKKHVTPNDLRRTFASWLVQQGVSLYVVSRLLGHKSTRMVELVYGQLDDATLTNAIANLPDLTRCDAGVPPALLSGGAAGSGGTSAAPLTIVNSVEESFTSTKNFVPRDGVEPPTRGFSVLTDLLPKGAPVQRKLRSLK
jgi:integrase